MHLISNPLKFVYQSITFIIFAISNCALFFNKSCIFIILPRTYRLLAYRNFTSRVHGRLGPGIRRVIPSCIVERIKKQFPEEDGVYTEFIQGDDDSAEYDASWILEFDA